MESTESSKQEVIFLFGAGASVDAGIPDTYKFVEEFKTFIKSEHSRLNKPVSRIIKIRERYNERVHGSEKRQVDVEQLLDTLRRLKGREKEPLLDFYTGVQFRSDLEGCNFAIIQEILENFIREKVVAKKENLGYLKELLKFDTPIEIYSTNYDTCIEQICYLNHMRYTDGFDVNWNEKIFKENYDVKHFKLHGSVIWYQNTKTKECVKIPVHEIFYRFAPRKLRLIYGEDVVPLLVYPAQKSEYVEPLTDLQLKLKQRLFDRATKVVFIIGYSFRDNYIVHMLWDAARVNENLHIFLISPNAMEVFRSKLEFIEEGTAPSRIADRVICLPYRFSSVAHLLKNFYLKNLLDLLNIEKSNMSSERKGDRVYWGFVLVRAIDCEFLTKVESLVEKLDIDWGESELADKSEQGWLMYSIKGLLSAIATRDIHESDWVERVNKVLERFDVKNLRIENIEIRGISLKFIFQKKNAAREYSFNEILVYWIDPVFSIWESKISLLGQGSRIESFDYCINQLSKFKEYLKTAKSIIEWENYLKLRGNDKDIGLLSSALAVAPINWENVRKIVLDIERRTLIETFGGNSLNFSCI